ncbi:MAG TPA: MerR family transcriptional regulator [Acidimicrobiales bacterium]|nr:MerR family transcriptional regulator [Acidimicrobiales bacterium]
MVRSSVHSSPPPGRRRGTAAPAAGRMTIDELARAQGTTTRHIRDLQTRRVLPHPVLVGRTGSYDAAHAARLRAVLELQEAGFSLAAIEVLVRAWERGAALHEVLGFPPPPAAPSGRAGAEDGEWADLDHWSPPRRGAALSVVPSTVLAEPAAS